MVANKRPVRVPVDRSTIYILSIDKPINDIKYCDKNIAIIDKISNRVNHRKSRAGCGQRVRVMALKPLKAFFKTKPAEEFASDAICSGHLHGGVSGQAQVQSVLF